MDGKVTDVDFKLNLVKVQYTDKSVDVFDFGDARGDASGLSINHNLSLMPNIKPGASVKADDIITYHSDFFYLDHTTKQLSWAHGVPATVAIMPKDVTLQDSCMVSNEFAKKLGFESVYNRAIHITSDMIVDGSVSIGDKVSYNDVLIKLRYEDTADIIGSDVDELFADLKQVEYRSKNEGVISDIKIYHVAEVLNQSLTKFISKMSYGDRRKANATKGTIREDRYITSTRVAQDTRIEGVALGENDILIVFYIKSDVACGVGDKLVFGWQLKSVIGRVEPNQMITDADEEIDVVFGANSVFHRVVLSPIITGIMDKIIIQAEQDILAMYFD